MDESPAGLSSEQAREQRIRDGPNRPGPAPDSNLKQRLQKWAQRVRALPGQASREPMLMLLLSCTALYWALGEPHDAALLGLAMAVIVLIDVVQQRRSARALRALQDLSTPQAWVMRDGRRCRISAWDVVRGDVLLLQAGERIAADARILQATDLQIDESMLTGESVPVAKSASQRAFAGTLVVRGRAQAQVEFIGSGTALGRIGQSLQTIEPTQSPLQKEASRLVRRLGMMGLVVCMVVVSTLVWRGQGWLTAALQGLALAMGLIPEEVPVVLTLFTALGAWRLTRMRVLTRHLSCIETLGAASVLCVDKTGTLTENRMRVVSLVLAENDAELGVQGESLSRAAVRELLHSAAMASPADSHDPMELAIVELHRQAQEGDGDSGISAQTPQVSSHCVAEHAAGPDLMAMSRVWRHEKEGRASWSAECKGAPEAVGQLCHLQPPQLARMQAAVERLAARGLRVIAVAQAERRHHGEPIEWPTAQRPAAASPTAMSALSTPQVHDYAYRYLGLLALADPLRSGVRDALEQCREAGIRVLMITGDHPLTARSIALQAGWDRDAQVLNGHDIHALSDEALQQRIAGSGGRSPRVGIVARAWPEHKLRIVQRLQAAGEVVGMTGDGVNDAPALKAADIGIAMGRRGSDVARESADLILTQDDFPAIVEAVRQGRRVDANLREVMVFIVAVHLPIAALALWPVAFGGAMVLQPMHIAMLELLIDPLCSIVFELRPAQPGQMKQAPRALRVPLIGPPIWRRAAVAGGSLTLAVVLALVWEPENANRVLGVLLLGIAALALVLLKPWAWVGAAAGDRPNPG